jgi:hypothetical protein
VKWPLSVSRKPFARLPQAGPNVGGATAGRRLTNVNAISGNPMKMP